MPHRQVFDLLITRSGDYWVATAGGLAHFNALAATSNSKFKTYIPTQRSGSEVINDLYEDNLGTIWAATGNGLHRLRQTPNDWQMEYVNLTGGADERLILNAIVEGPSGVLWIATEQGFSPLW